MPTPSHPRSRIRSRSPPASQRRSRSPSLRYRDNYTSYYSRRQSASRRFSPRRDERRRSPQTTWRSRSPHVEAALRSASRSRSPGRLAEASPSRGFGSSRRGSFAPSADSRYAKMLSPSRSGLGQESWPRLQTFPRSRSPSQGGRRDHRIEYTRRRSPISPSRCVSSIYSSMPYSDSSSRRSSPPIQSESINVARSCAGPRSPRKYDRFTGPISLQERIPAVDVRKINPDELSHRPSTEKQAVKITGKELVSERDDSIHSVRPTEPGVIPLNVVQPTVDTFTQTKGHHALSDQAPPSGPSHGVKSFPSQNRGNISLLSAPTRPRGGQRLKDSSWMGTLAARRVSMPATSLGPATVTRGSATPSTSGNEAHRPHRQHGVISAVCPRGQRFTDYLACLPQIIPGGKILSLGLDPAIGRRISQLETDKEKIMEQFAERHRFRRACVKDWGQVDRESSIGSLKSELAEGHLHQIAEGDDICRSTVF